MNKQERQVALQKIANIKKYAEELGDVNNVEDDQLKDILRKMLQEVEIHLPGESD